MYEDVREVVRELAALEKPFFNRVGLLVAGCSSSEIAGGVIGHNSAYELGEAVAAAVLACGEELRFASAFQCCEHLNRAIVIERAEAEKRNLTIVCAVPRMKAGGSLATAAYRAMRDPVLVETVEADAGIDIGQTLIGMHLKRVAVPVRLSKNRIGEALLTAARTRPKLIGGERAKYAPED
ncbi:MAG: TIGR01440 family protein [Clostridiales bacterium]|nr:TIGR01440 family protein [Clostridiales bacterium]